MKGGYGHNQVLLLPAETHCRALGARIYREHPVNVEGRRGAVDLLAHFRSTRLVIEGENTQHRVGWDIDKAAALRADALAILTPNCRVARACWRVVQRKGVPAEAPKLWICVLTLGAFHQWLDQSFRLFSGLFEHSKTIPGGRSLSTPIPKP